MPEVRNCRRCKKIFMFVTGPQLCDACKKLEEEEFERVRSFLKEFPGATIQEVARETEVPTQQIYKYLKEGRLEVAENSPIALQCENCGVRVKSGRFCINCSKKLANEMMNAGRSLKDSLDKEYRNEEDERRGLRYMHGIRKDEYK
ncbi:MAG: flagellar operon protein YvyF [Clostridiaceae bacterium]|nr:flagellar operon protein YvyF [Clostridiaceae bacterium]